MGGMQTRAASLWRPLLSGDSPQPTDKDFSLLQNGLSRLFLFVRRVAMPAENTTYDDTKVSADVFTERPVDGNVVANGVDQLAGDAVQATLLAILLG